MFISSIAAASKVAGGKKKYKNDIDVKEEEQEITIWTKLRDFSLKIYHKYIICEDLIDWVPSNPPGKFYHLLGKKCEEIVDSNWFNYSMLVIILFASALVGASTYKSFSGTSVSKSLDMFVLIAFAFEIILKIIALRYRPWMYFMNNDWKWNHFDFWIVMLCIPNLFNLSKGNSVAVLRLLRLMRVVKLVRKVPQLQMILMGLLNGLASIGYILLLLCLVFYLYAIIGVYLFRSNDPWHFRNLFVALMTMFRVATLANWSDVMYINYYGCEEFSGEIYHMPDYFLPPEEDEEHGEGSEHGEESEHSEGSEHGSGSEQGEGGATGEEHTTGEGGATGEEHTTEGGATGEEHTNEGGATGEEQTSEGGAGEEHTTEEGGAAGEEHKTVVTEEPQVRQLDAAFIDREWEDWLNDTNLYTEKPHIHQLDAAFPDIGVHSLSYHADEDVFVWSPHRGLSEGEGEEYHEYSKRFQEFHTCTHPSAKKLAAPAFFISFVVIASFVMISLFIGTVTMGMSQAMAKMKEEKEKALSEKQLKREQEKLEKAASKAHVPNHSPSVADIEKKNDVIMVEAKAIGKFKRVLNKAKRLREKEESVNSVSETAEQELWDTTRKITSGRELMRFLDWHAEYVLKNLLKACWEGQYIDTAELHVSRLLPPLSQPIKLFFLISTYCNWLSENKHFANSVTAAIILCAFLIGIQTYPLSDSANNICADLNDLVVAVFVAELVFKMFPLSFRIWVFFQNAWNCFDFVIVVSSFIRQIGSFTLILRLLRLLRILKLIKALPQLAVVINAMVMGISSIGFISLTMFLVFYLFANLGMLLFQENDPFYFGELHWALLSLFRVATLEDWCDIMYINFYGCDIFGYPPYMENPMECTDPKPQGWLSFIFFAIFVVIGAWIIFTLFIGVVSTSMDAAQKDQNKAMEIQKRLKEIVQKEGIKDTQVALYLKVFNMLDIDGGGSIEDEELAIGLKKAGLGNETLQSVSQIIQESLGTTQLELDIANFVALMDCRMKVGERNAKMAAAVHPDEPTSLKETPVKLKATRKQKSNQTLETSSHSLDSARSAASDVPFLNNAGGLPAKKKSNPTTDDAQPGTLHLNLNMGHFQRKKYQEPNDCLEETC